MSLNFKIIGHPNANDEHPSEGLCPRFPPADIISENVPSPIPRTIHIQTGSVESDEICRRFSLSEIRRATNNFDDYLVIGQGGFGKVYKGLFVDYGRPIVAIKRLNAESVQGAGEFWAEIVTLSKLRHGNLVNLIGYCDECQEMILVYEYIANGTLAYHLYRKRQGSNDYIYHPLSWEQRLKICIGAARGLDYLHSDSEQSVIHRDVKTANILLDENWAAKISDFGLSKMCATTHTQTHITTDIKGTFGYVDPEYFFTHRLTKKSDVYAFGVVLLEVLCARPPVERVEEEQFRSLSEWAQQCIKKRKFDQIIDPYLRGEISPSSLKLFADLAVKCLHKCPKERPAMDQLAERLEFALALQRRQPKAIITNYFSKVIKGLGVSLGFWIWKRYCSNSGLFLRFWRDPILGGKTVKQYRRFSLENIQAATNNFHDHLVMSHSSYYSDYKGLIDSGNLEVAIRRWKDGASNDNNLGQCRADILVQSQLRHLHIVSLIGYCKDKREIILVYARLHV
ncbi:receptor-like protein kinase FERONIA [Diospyros lotus]|uniref:receptor-like protein kinase FERONIA n=1 Tax=Diospyros lotus TaxID=55363 RepID=UPI00224DB654|nr:receptor-like protein kinase FERONIA [Diospyros lotus]